MQLAQRINPGAVLLPAVTMLLTGCADEEEPFATAEPDTFMVQVGVQPSDSARSDETFSLWVKRATAQLTDTMELDGSKDGGDGDGHDHAHAARKEEGHDDGHDTAEAAGHGFENHTQLLNASVRDYDVEVSILAPQHRQYWHMEDGEGSWNEEVPLTGDDRYLMVRIGSSAATGGSPHAHVAWDPEFAPGEEEPGHDVYTGMRQVHTGSVARITVDGTPYGGLLEVDDRQLTLLEGGHGPTYVLNDSVPDGTYNITVTVQRPSVDRLSDAVEVWQDDITFVFAGAEITTDPGDGSRGRDAGESAHFVVVDDFNGHAGYLKNHRGDASQSLDGTNQLVAQLRAGDPCDVYQGGVLTAPYVGDDICLGIRFFDPNGLNEHGDFFELSGCDVSVTITNQSSGNVLELYTIPTYSHEFGMHHGSNLQLPGGSADTPEEESDGHGHGH